MIKTKPLSQSEYSSYGVFNLKDKIQEQVNREAEYEHANDPRPDPPRYERITIQKNKPGWINFFLQLKP